MQSTTAAGHRKQYVVDLSRNVYLRLIVGDLLIGIIRIEETAQVLLVIPFTMGEVVLFGSDN
jgi:hypothetical protein